VSAPLAASLAASYWPQNGLAAPHSASATMKAAA
jgi:hypothetical protein